MIVLKILSAVFILGVIIRYDKIIARFKQNKYNAVRNSLNAGDKYLEELDKFTDKVK